MPSNVVRVPAALRAVAEEPMVRVLERALSGAANDGSYQIDSALAMALEANAAEKGKLAHIPSLRDPNGEAQPFFEEQAGAYKRLIHAGKKHDLFAGLGVMPERSR